MAQIVTLSEAAKLSNNLLIEGIIEDIVTVDQFFRFLPFVAFDGLSYTFTREKELAEAAFSVPGTNLDQTKYRAGATFENVNVNLTEIIGEIILDDHIANQFSETNDQLRVQMSSKAKAIGRLYSNAIINLKRSGALTQSNNGFIGIANRFNGMASILDAEQGNVDDVNHPFYNNGASTQSLELIEEDGARAGKPGRVFTLEDLDDVIDRVTSGQVDFMMMHSRDIRTLRVLLRNTGGGTDAVQIQQAGLGNARPQLYYQDVPVYRNDYVSRFDAVNTFSTTVSSVTDSDTVVLAADPTTSPTLAAGDVLHLHLRGSDGVMYRYETTGYAGGATIDVASVAGTFFDPEQNKQVSRQALDTAGLFPAGSEAVAAERIDGSSIYVGAMGEGKGVTGFTNAKSAGMKMIYVGPRPDENADQYRMVWYVGFDLYSRLSLARVKDCLGLGA